MMTIAWAALMTWPVIVMTLFRNYSVPIALCVSVFGGYLLLPSGLELDLPLLPPLDKYSIPIICAALMAALVIQDPRRTETALPGWLPKSKVALVLLALLVIGAFGTVLTNRDPLSYGPRQLPPLQLYDAFSYVMTLLPVVLPILLARKFLASVEGQRVLLLTITISALIYTIPALWEVRMSPQLHKQFYGYFPHSFMQQIRQSGFRPHVFLDHGLTLAIFFAFALIGATALARMKYQGKPAKWGLAAAWLFVALILSKSLGALLITLVILPVILFLTPRTQVLVAALIAGTVLTYPMLRSVQLVPINSIMSVAHDISPERAASLETRVTNEEALLAKARQRPLFGWGGWSRSRVFDSRGRDTSITDGAWIIEMGFGGWFRYVPIFGLLCWPLIALFFSGRDKIDPVATTLALILAAKLVDLLPNSGLHVFVWLLAGSLLGRVEMRAADVGKESVGEVNPAGSGYSYARAGGAEAHTQYARAFPKRTRGGSLHEMSDTLTDTQPSRHGRS